MREEAREEAPLVVKFEDVTRTVQSLSMFVICGVRRNYYVVAAETMRHATETRDAQMQWQKISSSHCVQEKCK